MIQELTEKLSSIFFLGNDLVSWLLAVAGTCVLYLALGLFLRVFRKNLERLCKRSMVVADKLVLAALGSTKQLALFVVALWGGLRFVDLGDAEGAFDLALIVAVTLQAAIWVNKGISQYLVHYTNVRKDENPGSISAVQALSFVIRVIVWSIALLLIIDNLGYEVTALVAGLGIGGIAIALAVQNILGDLFASLSIVLDKPFVVGDFIIVGDLLGVVDRIGIKTTRVRSLSGEQLVFANSDLLNSRIRNFKRMYERRVAFNFGVTYQTTPEQLESVPPMIKEIVTELDHARFDRAHFMRFGESSFDYEVVYYVLSPDFNIYMDIQQALNLGIYRGLQERGIEFAYPTRTLYVKEERGNIEL